MVKIVITMQRKKKEYSSRNLGVSNNFGVSIAFLEDPKLNNY